MVKFYTLSYSYDYSFPAVCLAYFLRYPNPYSTHVLSTDVIDSEYSAEAQQLTTYRLHLKKSKLPTAVLKLVPRSLLGASEKGDSESYILERSIVNVKEGWMRTESKNLDWTGVLSVIESQEYRRPNGTFGDIARADPLKQPTRETTDVTTTVTLRSHVGENLRKRRARMAEAAATNDQEAQPTMGFFRTWTTGSIQRSVELIGLRRAEGAQPKAKEGMKVVLERLRQGGLVAVLEGMRKDRELMFAGMNAPPPPPQIERQESSAVDIDWQDS